MEQWPCVFFVPRMIERVFQPKTCIHWINRWYMLDWLRVRPLGPHLILDPPSCMTVARRSLDGEHCSSIQTQWEWNQPMSPNPGSRNFAPTPPPLPHHVLLRCLFSFSVLYKSRGNPKDLFGWRSMRDPCLHCPWTSRHCRSRLSFKKQFYRTKKLSCFLDCTYKCIV